MKPFGHSTATKTRNRKRNLIQSIHSKKWKFQKCYVWYNPESEKYLSSVVQSLPQNLYDNVFPTYVVISFSTFSHSLWTNWCQIVMNRYSLPRSNNPLLYWRIQAIVKLYNVHFDNGGIGEFMLSMYHDWFDSPPHHQLHNVVSDKAMSIWKMCVWRICWNVCSEAYLILVADATSGVSVKFVKWGEFFHTERERDPCVIWCIVCKFTHHV